MTDVSTIERALTIIAAAVALQTLLLIGLGVSAWIAYRRTAGAIGAQLADLQQKTEALSITVNRAADSVTRGAHVVTAAIDDARQSAQTVGAWLNTAASVVTTPRTAAAVGVLRGVQWWKNRRHAAKLARATRVY